MAVMENTLPSDAARLHSNSGFVYGWGETQPPPGLGPWYPADAEALSVGLSNAEFKSLDLLSLAEK